MLTMIGAFMVSVCTAGGGAGQTAVRAPSRASQPAAAPELGHFRVRQGYRVTVAVEHIPGARFLEVDDRGTLYVSRPSMGDIVALRDTDGDGVYETRADFISGLPFVQAMCFAHGGLWYASTGSIHTARDTDGDGAADEAVDILPLGSLPRGGVHWWRSLLVTGDSIYTSIGDGRNASDQTGTERQKIWRFDLDGSNKRLFASGIRDNEKLRLRPGTDEVWGCDQGSDWFGRGLGDKPGNQPFTDLNPPDELNHYTEGGFYGHPFLTGNRVPRPEHRDHPDLHTLAAATTPPAWSFPPHASTNAFTFIDPARNTGKHAFPKDHEGDLFVAFHGSWNSTRRVGYGVARVLFDKDGIASGGGGRGAVRPAHDREHSRRGRRDGAGPPRGLRAGARRLAPLQQRPARPGVPACLRRRRRGYTRSALSGPNLSSHRDATPRAPPDSQG